MKFILSEKYFFFGKREVFSISSDTLFYMYNRNHKLADYLRGLFNVFPEAEVLEFEVDGDPHAVHDLYIAETAFYQGCQNELNIAETAIYHGCQIELNIAEITFKSC